MDKKIITNINGTDIISKSYNTINENFQKLYLMILDILDNIGENARSQMIEDVEWMDDSGGKLGPFEKFEYVNGESTRAKNPIPSASPYKSGVVNTDEQTFAGNKKFQDKIYMLSELVGKTGNTIISQTGNTVCIGDKFGKGIVIQYDNYGNFRSINVTTTNGNKDIIELITDVLNDRLNNRDTKKLKKLGDITFFNNFFTNQEDRVITHWFDTIVIDDNNKSSIINSKNNYNHFTPWNKDSLWSDDVLELKPHINDTYTDTNNKKCYMYQFNSSTQTYIWAELNKNNYQDYIESLLECSTLKSTEDGRLNVFNRKPKEYYSFGDMWYISNDDMADTSLIRYENTDTFIKVNGGKVYANDVLFCNKDFVNNFDILDWDNTTSYSTFDDLNKKLEDLANQINNQEDQSRTIWFGTYDPTKNTTATDDENEYWINGYFIPSKNVKQNYVAGWNPDNSDKHIGDLYIKTDTNINYEFIKSSNSEGGYEWKQTNSPDSDIESIITDILEDLGYGGLLDGNINIFAKTYDEMNHEDSYHKKGDIWICMDSPNITTDNGRIFNYGSFYLCIKDDDIDTDSDNEDDAQKMHTDQWILLTDFDSKEEKEYKQSIYYYEAKENYLAACKFTEEFKNKTNYNASDLNWLRTFWKKISGYDYRSLADQTDIYPTLNDIQNFYETDFKSIYKEGSFGKVLDVLQYHKDKIINSNDFISQYDIINEFNYIGVQLFKNDVNLYNRVVGDIITPEINKSIREEIIYYTKMEYDIYEKLGVKNTYDHTISINNSFDVEQKSIEDGSTDINGGLILTNLIQVRDTFNDGGKVTGGLSGISGDRVGLFLGCNYDDAYKAANNGEGQVPVLLTKDGKGSNIGGIQIDKVVTSDNADKFISNIPGELVQNSISDEIDIKSVASSQVYAKTEIYDYNHREGASSEEQQQGELYCISLYYISEDILGNQVPQKFNIGDIIFCHSFKDDKFYMTKVVNVSGQDEIKEIYKTKKGFGELEKSDATTQFSKKCRYITILSPEDTSGNKVNENDTYFVENTLPMSGDKIYTIGNIYNSSGRGNSIITSPMNSKYFKPMWKKTDDSWVQINAPYTIYAKDIDDIFLDDTNEGEKIISVSGNKISSVNSQNVNIFTSTEETGIYLTKNGIANSGITLKDNSCIITGDLIANSLYLKKTLSLDTLILDQDNAVFTFESTEIEDEDIKIPYLTWIDNETNDIYRLNFKDCFEKVGQLSYKKIRCYCANIIEYDDNIYSPWLYNTTSYFPIYIYVTNHNDKYVFVDKNNDNNTTEDLSAAKITTINASGEEILFTLTSNHILFADDTDSVFNKTHDMEYIYKPANISSVNRVDGYNGPQTPYGVIDIFYDYCSPKKIIKGISALTCNFIYYDDIGYVYKNLKTSQRDFDKSYSIFPYTNKIRVEQPNDNEYWNNTVLFKINSLKSNATWAPSNNLYYYFPNDDKSNLCISEYQYNSSKEKVNKLLNIIDSFPLFRDISGNYCTISYKSLGISTQEHQVIDNDRWTNNSDIIKDCKFEGIINT